MPETCPYCNGEFANTKALGSHIHYRHDTIYLQKDRSEVGEERFRRLLNGCCSARGLLTPRDVEKIEQAIKEVPEGISPALDPYRDAFRCAHSRAKLVKEVEELLRESNAE